MQIYKAKQKWRKRDKARDIAFYMKKKGGRALKMYESTFIIISNPQQ